MLNKSLVVSKIFYHIVKWRLHLRIDLILIILFLITIRFEFINLLIVFKGTVFYFPLKIAVFYNLGHFLIWFTNETQFIIIVKILGVDLLYF